MKIVCIKQEKHDLSDLADNLPDKIKLDIRTRDWETKEEVTEDIFLKEGSNVDGVIFFVDKIEGYKESYVGIHFGEKSHTYEVGLVEMRDRYYDTAYHEIMHMVDDIVYEYLGINLAQIVGVKDWDEDVVHGRNRHYVEYEYDNVFSQVSLYVQRAVRKRRKELNYLARLSIALRRLIVLLKRQNELIMTTKRNKDDGEKENKLLLWAEGVKKAEGWEPGNLTYRFNNPGALRWSPYQDAKRQGFAYFSNYDKGWKALVHQLRIIADGRSNTYNQKAKEKYGLESCQELTIRQWVDIWAPVSDNNLHNDNYAQRVADTIGVTTDTKVKSLIS